MVYVGPDNKRTHALVERFAETRQDKPFATASRLAMVAGCSPVATRLVRIIRRLAEYVFSSLLHSNYHACVLAMGNMLGVRWRDGAATRDVDFAHAGQNVSLALPADLKIDAHGALESLEIGLLPIAQFNGKACANYRKELRLDFVTCMNLNGKPVVMPHLNLALETLKFMEFFLETLAQACVFSNLGACFVNLSAPERYALHKLIA
jgi:hypothetical protein